MNEPVFPLAPGEQICWSCGHIGQPAELFYLQSRLAINGNTAMWMTKDFEAYTADVRKAHVFTQAEAQALDLTSHSLQLWPKAQIDQLTRPTVSLAELQRSKP